MGGTKAPSHTKRIKVHKRMPTTFLVVVVSVFFTWEVAAVGLPPSPQQDEYQQMPRPVRSIVAVAVALAIVGGVLKVSKKR